MSYLERQEELRRDVRNIWPEARSVVVLAHQYPIHDSWSREQNTGAVAAYAHGLDYHYVLKEKLERLLSDIREELCEDVDGTCFVDSGPLSESALAVNAGIGWKGKNTLIIHPRFGSNFLLAELVLNVSLPPMLEHIPDRCGTCTRCMDTCPTGAIVAPHVLDARRCISYLTIEHRGPIPRELRPLLGTRIFGCDVCQVVCPWNRKAERDAAGEDDLAAVFQPDERLTAPDLIELLSITGREFKRRFARSPVLRARRKGLARNVAVALGNMGDETAVPALQEALKDADPVVRSHAGWALARIPGSDARAVLNDAIRNESDDDAHADLSQTLSELP